LYPRLIKRVRAVLIDSVITPTLLFLSMVIVGGFAIESNLIRNVISFVPALSLEPLMVAFTGGTIGHHAVGIKVRYADEDKNISIIHAVFRFLLKLLLGLPSLVMVLITKKHQAIHDALSQSIVVHRSTEALPESEVLEERIIEEDGYIYPGIMRRVLVIVIYGFLVTTLLTAVFYGAVSSECMHNGTCSKSELTKATIINYGHYVTLIALIVLGWKSKLYGCRKKRE